jgi:hypothetical protein
LALGAGWAFARSSSVEFQTVKKVQKGQAVAVYVAGTGAQNTTSSDGLRCERTVVSNVTTANLTVDTLSYTAVAAAVTWTSATGSGVDTGVAIIDPGTPALRSERTLAPGTRQTYSGFAVRFSTPCAARTAYLAIGVTTQYGFGHAELGFLGAGTGTGTTAGTALPIGMAAALGVMVVAGVGLLVVRRRDHRGSL